MAVGRKEVVLEKGKSVPVGRGQEERRWWCSFVFPTISSLGIEMDITEQNWKCGTVFLLGKKN